MRILITGATGYLGFHFAKLAINQGHEILCLKRRDSVSLFDSSVEREIQWVDIDSFQLEKIVGIFKPEVLFHSAWGGVRGEGRDSLSIQKKNLQMSIRLFQLYPYEQIIAIGSQAEYGFYTGLVNENHELNPETAYAKAKIDCCNQLKIYCEKKNIEWQWIRVFTVFGEKQTGGIIKFFIEKCLNNELAFDTTNGEQVYSYLYSKDFALSICNILGVSGKSGIYNLSQKRSIYSNKELLERIKTKLNNSIQINYGAVPYAHKQIMFMDGDTSKFEKAFGPIHCTNFEEALDKTIQSLINQ